MRITRMLWIISSVFCVFNLPHNVVRLIEMVQLLFYDINVGDVRYMTSNLTMCMYYVNFAINCVLYNATNSKFRDCAVALLRRWFHCCRTSALTEEISDQSGLVQAMHQSVARSPKGTFAYELGRDSQLVLRIPKQTQRTLSATVTVD